MSSDDGRQSREVAGAIAAVVAPASNQSGAALGAMSLPALGPPGLVAVRQIVSAGIFLSMVRPQFSRMTAREWQLVVALGLVMGLQSVAIYAAVARIGLGLAITLGFMGPLTVAVVSSRRILDFLCLFVATAGLIVLVNPGVSSDFVGIGLALFGAVNWGTYILLSRRVGACMRGLRGTAASTAISLVIWVPVAVIVFVWSPPPLWALGLAIGCGLFSSVVAYAIDMFALRRIPAGLYGALASFNPVWAALAGLVLLGEALGAA